jgi:hypothetical protein
VRVAVLAMACLPVPALGQTRAPANAAEWERVKPLFKLVEQVAAGELTPSSVAVAWQCHFFKADAGVLFVPFTVQVAPGALPASSLAMYLRVVLRGAPAPAPGPRDPLAQYPFEDGAIVDRPQDGRVSRAFTAPPGQYDVYIALASQPASVDSQPKSVVIKQAVDVPDFGSGFSVSSIVLLEKSEVDARTARLSFEEQLNEPYSLWGARLTPALGNTFDRAGNLSVMFLVYNTAQDADGKPDVEVQYSFYRNIAGAETFFARAKPQRLNAATLGAQFNLAAGNLVIAGQQMPLASFPPGEYRLAISVTDAAQGSSLTRDIGFTVAGS